MSFGMENVVKAYKWDFAELQRLKIIEQIIKPGYVKVSSSSWSTLMTQPFYLIHTHAGQPVWHAKNAKIKEI